MTISPGAMRVDFDGDQMRVRFGKGRAPGVALAWFARLLRAAADDSRDVGISPRGLRWAMFDKDISIEGLLHGRGDMTRTSRRAA